ncbi:MAG: hypothetical protein IT423_11790 [Pirellulaceae bacterium]|nr:hypothetical protein [Pirellulaceae bacterium]
MDAQAEQQIRRSVEQLAERAVRLYRWRAGLWCVGASLLSTVCFVAFDYGLHVEEVGLRWMLSLLWLASTAAIATYFLPSAWQFSLSPVRVAQWIEQKRPELRGELSNLVAVGELPLEDLRFGSQDLRTAARKMASHPLTELPWHSFLDPRPTRRAALMCGLSIAVVGLLLAVAPAASRGLQRIAFPWASAPWPKSDQLELVSLPSMIAIGSELEVQVIDRRPPFPADVQLQLQSQNDRSNSGNANLGNSDSGKIVTLPLRVLGDLALVTLPAMEADFSIRPVGGDDRDTTWQNVRVARLPDLVEHHFNVQPPAYSGQTGARLVGQRIEVLSGSEVSFHGRFDAPVRSVKAIPIATTSTTPGTRVSSNNQAVTDPIPGLSAWDAQVASDGQSFQLFASGDVNSSLEQDRSWQLSLETIDGLVVRDDHVWTIRIIRDREPTLTLVPIEPQIITRQAVLPIVGQASDDLGLVEVTLIVRAESSGSASRDAASNPIRQTLWQRAAPSTTSPPAASAEASSTTAVTPTTADALDLPSKQVDISTIWQAADLRLVAGESVTVEMEARDTAGQTARSLPQTLQIQDEQAVLAQLQAKQAETFGPLRQLLESQKRNQQAIDRTRNIVRQTEQVEQSQVDALSNVRQLEQSVAETLTSGPRSLLNELNQLQQQLSRNALADSNLAEESGQLSQQIQQLQSESLEPALKSLDEAERLLRQAETDTGSLPAAIDQLNRAAQSHQRVTDQLARLVNSVAAAESLADVHKQIQELATQQDSLLAETQRLQIEQVIDPRSKQTSGKRVGVRSDQQSLARSVEDLINKLGQKLETSSTSSPPSTPPEDPANNPAGNSESADLDTALDTNARAVLQAAKTSFVDQRVADQMRQAAELVEAEQLSDAVKTQRLVAESLERVASHFRARDGGNLASSSENLQEIAEQLRTLVDQQGEMTGQLKRAQTSNADISETADLARQQAELAKRVESIAQQARESSSQRLIQSLESAQAAAQRASQQASDRELSEASQSAQDATDQLVEAQRNAQQRAEQLEQQLAEQQMLDLRGLVSDLAKRQEPVVERLKQLADPQPTQPEPNIASDVTREVWSKQLREAAATEEQIRQQLQARHRLSNQAIESTANQTGTGQDNAHPTEALDTFDWLLNQCDEELARTVAALERQRVRPEALSSAEMTLDLLRAAEIALNSKPVSPDATDPDSNSDNPKSDPTQDQRSTQDPNKRRPALASLKLLREVQTMINLRTDRLLEQGLEQSDPEFARLADQQQALAEQAEKIIRDLK